ncbi:MAG: hypothetical protein HFJ38_03605 [Bacilli bacterium]|nr:hypothetical protein [Bacilli bacterium]
MYKYLREYIDKDEFQLTLLKHRVNIVNYEELLQISEKEIVLKSRDEKIIITGDKLAISKLLDYEILIIGEISNIEVLYG